MTTVVKPAPSNLTPEELVRHMEHNYPNMDANWRRVLDLLELAIERYDFNTYHGERYAQLPDKEKHKNSIVS